MDGRVGARAANSAARAEVVARSKAADPIVVRRYHDGYVRGRERGLGASSGRDVARVRSTGRARFELEADDGGEEVFLARALAGTTGAGHHAEAGTLAGALLGATGSRFFVSEEECAEDGAPCYRFLAVRE